MDKLLIYLGENLKINDQITIYQPSILDIAKYGENHYHYRCGEQRGKSLKILARLYIKSHAVAKQHHQKHLSR